MPGGLAEAIGAAISPGDVAETHLTGNRASSSFEVRRTQSDYDRELAQWNLTALDVGLLDGIPEIWQRPDPPPAPLAALCALGDARDAGCAFRFPIALDGTVPGFRVRRGRFGHEEIQTATGPSLRIGQLPGRDAPITVAVNDLTKHTLIAGSTGSGKTTTVLELLRQLWLDHRVPFLVIEPVNSDADDYRRLLASRASRTLRSIPSATRGPGRCASTRSRCPRTSSSPSTCEPARLLHRRVRAVGAASLDLSGRAQHDLSRRRDPRRPSVPPESPGAWPTRRRVPAARCARSPSGLGYAGEVQAQHRGRVDPPRRAADDGRGRVRVLHRLPKRHRADCSTTQ